MPIRKVKDPSPPLHGDRRRRTVRRREALERALCAKLTAQGRTLDVDALMWVEQAAVSKVNLEIFAAMESRGQHVEPWQKAKASTDLSRALRNLKLKPASMDAPAPPRPTPTLSQLLREHAGAR